MTTKRPYQFPEELIESTGGGPDFPGSSGDRERGKFRPGEIPRKTTVAVVADDGRPVVRSVAEVLSDMLLYQKAILLALSYQAEGESFTMDEVLEEASRF